MPNRTIYVRQEDEKIFKAARELSGEPLSSLIVKALKAYLERYRQNELGMKEVLVKVGDASSRQEQLFLGKLLGSWKGFTDDHALWLESEIYITQKGNLAIYHKKIFDSKVITNPNNWQDYKTESARAELVVGSGIAELTGKIPEALLVQAEKYLSQIPLNGSFLDI